jgi:hypothetical protein
MMKLIVVLHNFANAHKKDVKISFVMKMITRVEEET